MTNQLVMAKKSRSRLTTAKVVRAIGIFILGCVVFATKHAIQQSTANSGDPANMVRRSSEVMYNSIQQKEEKNPSTPIAQKLKMEPKDDFSLAKRYIIEAIPSAYVNKQNPKVKSEFESRLKKRNVTRWQYPDFVHVSLTDLGVVFLNGQRFYQQQPVHRQSTVQTEPVQIHEQLVIINVLVKELELVIRIKHHNL